MHEDQREEGGGWGGKVPRARRVQAGRAEDSRYRLYVRLSVTPLYLSADCDIPCYTAKNEQLVAILFRTGLNNILLHTLLNTVKNNVQHCYTDSASTCEQCGQQNIVQSCYTAGLEFLAGYRCHHQ